jgi:multiple antibiotic resistance protein
VVRVISEVGAKCNAGLVTDYNPRVDLNSVVDLSEVVTLLLMMDPFGNVPVFLAVLRPVPPLRRRIVILREVLIAYAILFACVFVGDYGLRLLGLQTESVSIAGAIVLFLIAVRMVFPTQDAASGEVPEREPFIVPLAVPLFAGPSALAALLLLQQQTPGETVSLLLAMTIAWAISSIILLSSTFFHRVLGDQGLSAAERLTGMVLVMIAVQMFLDGLKAFLA